MKKIKYIAISITLKFIGLLGFIAGFAALTHGDPFTPAILIPTSIILAFAPTNTLE